MSTSFLYWGHKFKRIHVLLLIAGIIFYCDSFGQVDRSLYDEVKDSIVSKFKRHDFKAIYQLSDTAFSNKISENQLVNFLKGNQNSGRILNSSFQSSANEITSYLLECELRDIILKLAVTPEKKMSSFGFANSPPVLLDRPPAIKTDNPMQSPFDAAVDSAAREYFRYSKATSLTIGIIKNGKKYVYNYGETKKGSGHLATGETLYELGSITKTFTATLLAKAVLDKKLSLSDDIRKYMTGDWHNLSYKETPVTLRDLANHTSGLPTLPVDIGDQPGYDPVNPEAAYDSAMFYEALHGFSLDTVPGYRFLYSNWGMSLLGHILEKVYGVAYPVLLDRYITKPLHMAGTRYLPESEGIDVITPYSENGKPIPLANEGYFSPAGGICSGMNDMLLYLDAQLSEKNESIQLTHRPTINAMGLAWGARTKDGLREFQHNGSTQGSTSHISAFPDINSGCVILVNNKVNMGKLIVTIQGILRRH